MTQQQHPITPSPELVQQWLEKLLGGPVFYHSQSDQNILAAIAQWGADQELEACCEWLQDPDLNVDTYKLRAARRPKPPSLKQEALDELDRIPTHDSEGRAVGVDVSILRRALEQLPDNE